MKKTLRTLCVLPVLALLLGACDGISYNHTYRVQLSDGSNSFLHSAYRMNPGERFKGATHGSTWLYEEATGNISGTILSETR